MAAPLRAAVYARVSSDKQRERHTIGSQLSTLPAYVTAQGWTLAGTYTDDGHTAKAGHLAKREAFTKLLEDARAGRFDVVVVIDLDRLTRSEDLRERGEVLGAFQLAGIRIAVASSGQILDLRSSMGDLMSSLSAFFAAEENRKRRERTVRGRLEAARAGRPSSTVPYGLRYTRANGWTLHPERAPIVRELFERVAAGESTEQIAADMQARGVRRARSDHWQRERVYAIVTQPAYRGQWVANTEHRVSIEVPPIVDETLWHQTQDVLLVARRRGLRRTRYVYLLEGIATCGACGSAVHIHSTPSGSNGVTLRYYYCKRRRRARFGESCPMRLWRVDEAEARIWDAVSRFLERPDLPERVAAFLAASAAPSASTYATDLAGYERHLDRLHRTEGTLLERFRRDLVSQEALDRELERLSAERRLLVRQIESARQQIAGATAAPTTPPVLDMIERLRDGLETADPETRRELVRALVPGGGQGVVLRADEIELHIVLAEARQSMGLEDASATRKPHVAKLAFTLVA